MKLILFLLFLQFIYGSVFNGGCLTHDKSISNFCEKIGCNHQSGDGKSYVPSIMFYLDENNNVNINFLCKQSIKKNNHYGSKYEIAYTNIQKEFHVPYTQNEIQYWYGPSFTTTNGTIELMFSNIKKFNSNDTIELVNEENKVFCGYKIGNIIENYNYIIQSNFQSYKVKVSINDDSNKVTPCKTLSNYTVSNKHLRYNRPGIGGYMLIRDSPSKLV